MSERWTRWAVVGSIAIAIVGLTAAGATGQDLDVTPLPDPTLSEEELRSAAETLEPTARAKWPETFAGVWLGEEGIGGPIYVAFSEGAEAKVAELALDFPRPDLLRPVAVDRSLSELEKLLAELHVDREQIRNDRLSLNGVSNASYDLGIDIRQNTVYAQMTSVGADTAQTFSQRYGEPLALREGAVAQPADCDSRADCKPNLRSGLRTAQAAGGACSTGFVVRHEGDRRVLSAAHCGVNDGDDVGRRHNGERYGEVKQDAYSGAADVEVHSVTSASGFDAKPWIFVDFGARQRDVFFTGNYEGLLVGDTTCKSGITTNKTCGEVLGKHFEPSYVPNSERFIKAAFCSNGGDSGAGVYINHKAVGIESGSSDLNSCEPSDFSVFGHIEFAENRLNAAVVHAP